MKNSQNRKIPYPNWKWRLGAALVGAHFAVLERQTKPFWHFIHRLDYNVAIITSTVIGVLLIWLIHYMTKKFDIYLPWTKNWFLRALCQIFCCLICIIYLDLALVMFYFDIFNNDFEASGYRQVEFPMVKWMIFSVNLIYLIIYLYNKYAVADLENESLIEEKGQLESDLKVLDAQNEMLSDQNEQLSSEKEMLSVEVLSLQSERLPDGPFIKFVKAITNGKVSSEDVNDIICLERDDTTGYIYLNDGRRLNMDFKLKELNNMLDPNEFQQINRSVIISKRYISGYHNILNGQAEITLKNGFETMASLKVSRGRMDEFRKFYDNFS